MAGFLGGIGSAIDRAKIGAAKANYNVQKNNPNATPEQIMSAYENAHPELRPEVIRANAPKAGTPQWNAGVTNAKVNDARNVAATNGMLTFDPSKGVGRDFLKANKLIEHLAINPDLVPDVSPFVDLAKNQGNKFFAEGERVANAGPIVGPTAGAVASNDILGNVRGDANAVVGMANQMYGGLLGGTESGAGEAMYAANMAQLEGQRTLAAERLQNQQNLAAQSIQQQGQMAQDNAIRNALAMAGSARGGNFGASNAAAMNAQAMGTQAANSSTQNQLANLRMQGLGQAGELEMSAANERANAAKEAAYLRAQEIAQARNAMIGAQGDATKNLLNFGNLGVEENRATTEAALKDYITRMGEKWQNYNVGIGRQDASAAFKERAFDDMVRATAAVHADEMGNQEYIDTLINRGRAQDASDRQAIGMGMQAFATAIGGIGALNTIGSQLGSDRRRDY